MRKTLIIIAVIVTSCHTARKVESREAEASTAHRELSMERVIQLADSMTTMAEADSIVFEIAPGEATPGARIVAYAPRHRRSVTTKVRDTGAVRETADSARVEVAEHQIEKEMRAEPPGGILRYVILAGMGVFLLTIYTKSRLRKK